MKMWQGEWLGFRWRGLVLVFFQLVTIFDAIFPLLFNVMTIQLVTTLCREAWALRIFYDIIRL
jgi:hypothetical protein